MFVLFSACRVPVNEKLCGQIRVWLSLKTFIDILIMNINTNHIYVCTPSFKYIMEKLLPILFCLNIEPEHDPNMNLTENEEYVQNLSNHLQHILLNYYITILI